MSIQIQLISIEFAEFVKSTSNLDECSTYSDELQIKASKERCGFGEVVLLKLDENVRKYSLGINYPQIESFGQITELYSEILSNLRTTYTVHASRLIFIEVEIIRDHSGFVLEFLV